MSFEYIKKRYIERFCDNHIKSIFCTYSATTLSVNQTKKTLTPINTKLQIYKKNLKNQFLSNDMMNEYQQTFCQIQRFYRIFSKIAQKWRFKKTPIHNHENLYMAPISIHDPNVIPVIQNGQIYLFTVREVLNGMNSAL
jgi:predicted DNA-binding protein YlxM (UPF0122 family)